MRLRFILPFVLAIAPLAQSPVLAQSIHGKVTDEVSGRPVMNATVFLIDDRRRVLIGTITDSSGQYSLRPPKAGRYTLRIDASGYTASLSSPFESAAGENLTVDLPINRAVAELAPVTVTAEAPPFAPGPIRDFYQRQRRGWGLFLTRDYIEERRPLDLTDLFRNLPGITVVGRGGRRNDVLGRRGCSMRYYLDGFRYTSGESGINEILVSDVEAVEIYRSAAETPADFQDPRSTCGVIVIWTRRG